MVEGDKFTNTSFGICAFEEQFWGRHLWSRGYLAVSSGNITDEIIQKYIEDQEGEPVIDNSRFQIDPS